jgi:hypothetical protein
MVVTLEIPDDVAERMGGDLSRRALEALVAEGYKSGHLTGGEVRGLLGFATVTELDGFLKAHGVLEDYTVEDLRREVEEIRRLGY